MRRFAVSAGLLLAVCGCLVVLPAPALAAAPTLVASPDRGTLAAGPVISGSCPTVDSPAGPVVPPETVLTLNGSGSGPWKVPLAADGTFTGFVAGLSADTAPGPYAFATDCGGAAPFTVLSAPAVRLVPAAAPAGTTTVAAGSCPRPRRGTTPAPDVRLDGRLLGTAPFDPRTGEFGPFPVAVSDDAALGPHEVTTSCGGRTTFPVLPPIAAPASPGTALIVVPDLRGRTGTQATAALAGRLVLVGSTGGPGRIRSQEPPPGTRVRPGSAVLVVLEAAVRPSSTGAPLLAVAAVVTAGLLLLVAALVAARGLPRRRARRWVDEHATVRPGRTYLELSDVPRGQVPGLSVRLVVHRDEAPQLSDEGATRAGH